MSAYERASRHHLPERGPKSSPSRRFRWRWLAPTAVLLLPSPAVYSYTTTMLEPSSLPLTVRSVEWVRAHHGNWLVDEVEHYYYSWKAPKKGGPQLKSLPTVGLLSDPAEDRELRRQHDQADNRDGADSTVPSRATLGVERHAHEDGKGGQQESWHRHERL